MLFCCLKEDVAAWPVTAGAQGGCRHHPWPSSGWCVLESNCPDAHPVPRAAGAPAFI